MSTVELDDDIKDRRRLDSIPVWGAGPIPSERAHAEVKSVRGFADVMRIFLRAWPYLLPMVLGYWRERTIVRDVRGDIAEVAIVLHQRIRFVLIGFLSRCLSGICGVIKIRWRVLDWSQGGEQPSNIGGRL